MSTVISLEKYIYTPLTLDGFVQIEAKTMHGLGFQPMVCGRAVSGSGLLHEHPLLSNRQGGSNQNFCK